MKKLLTAFIILTLLMSLLLGSQAMAALMLCERPCSNNPTEHILDNWRIITSYWENCTAHPNCTIRYNTYGKNYKCVPCGYHHSYPTERKTDITHNQSMRLFPMIMSK